MFQRLASELGLLMYIHSFTDKTFLRVAFKLQFAPACKHPVFPLHAFSTDETAGLITGFPAK